MSQELKEHLKKALHRFTEAREKIESSFGYCQSSEEIRVLEELIKEQRPDEDLSHTASQAR